MTAERRVRLEDVRLLFVVNVDWFFISHRLPLLDAAVAEGATVAVAAADTGRLHELAERGATVIALPMSRSGIGPIEQVRSLVRIMRTVRAFRPDLVHNVTIKPVLLGTLATRLLTRRARVVNAISGFGFAVEGDAHGLLRRFVMAAYRLLFRSQRVTVVVQNDDARRSMLDDGLAHPDRLVLIEGSGVDCEVFVPRSHEPRGDAPIRVVMASRILRDKGVAEFCRAVALLDASRVEAVLAGSLDPGGNPTAFSGAELDQLCGETGVRYVGDVDDMPGLLRSADIVVLPSYHEGLPKVLLEAAATGLPLVATDIAGCRPVVHPGVNGELVDVGAIEPLAAAIDRLAGDADLRERYGRASRELAVDRFSLEHVVDGFVELYEREAVLRDR